jgi:DNA-binding LytR/AlgR family response regulator
LINAVIIEDEKAAQEKLLNTLKEVIPDLTVKAILTSVKESIEYFRENLSIDIIFCDVQLPDGLSFQIFNETSIKIPVIFITGYDKFILYAFENNGIDYLLKPVNKEDLARAIFKYKMLEKHFTVNNQSLYNLIHSLNIKKKTRLLVKRGLENVSVRLEDVVMFYTENKLVYVIDKSGQKLIIDRPLNELESELDDSVFFRANRQYIINLAFVKSYKPYEKVKLQVDLHVHEKTNHFIIISQSTAPNFRKWISEA